MDVRNKIQENAKHRKYQVIAVRPTQIDGCIRYRMDIPVKYLTLYGNDYFFYFRDSPNDDHFFFSDLIYMHQAQASRMGKKYTLREVARATGTKIVMDYNDDVWSIPESNPAFLEDPVRVDIEKTLRMVDAVEVTTKAMVDVVKKFHSNIAIIPNYFDMNTYLNLFVSAEEAHSRWKKRGKTIIGYVGSANHTDDQSIFYDAMAGILRERHDVELRVMGIVPVKYTEEFGAKIKVQKRGFAPLNTYYYHFGEHEIDILCNPLINSGFNHCKSNIKWLEGTYLGSTIVSSPIEPYASLFDCCSCVPWDNDPQVEMMNWREELEYMLDNPDERFDMLDKSQKYMAEEWDISVKWHQWDTFFKKVLNNESVAGLDFTPKRKVENEVQSKPGVRAVREGDSSGGDIGTVPMSPASDGCGEQRLAYRSKAKAGEER